MPNIDLTIYVIFMLHDLSVTFRTLLRWVCLIFVHCCIIYFGTVFELSQGGGISSAYDGLMDDPESTIGDGEGGDLRRYVNICLSLFVDGFSYAN